MTEIVVVCPPITVSPELQAVTGLSAVLPTEGAIAGECEECKVPIWIGPKSQAAIGKASTVLCMMCALPRASKDNVISLGGKSNTYVMKDGSTVE